jgi:hypothetical protein
VAQAIRTQEMRMKEVLVPTMHGIPLDWAVAQVLGTKVMLSGAGPSARLVYVPKRSAYKIWQPSNNPKQGGQVIEAHGISITARKEGGVVKEWWATLGDPNDEETLECVGPTALIAAMRTLVYDKLGDEKAMVAIPRQFCQA